MLVSKIKKIEGGRVITKDTSYSPLYSKGRFSVVKEENGTYSIKSGNKLEDRGIVDLETAKKICESMFNHYSGISKDALAGEHYHVEQYAPDMFSVEDPVGESVGSFKTKAEAEAECKKQNDLYMKDSNTRDSRMKDEVPFSQAKIIEKSAEMVWGRKPTTAETEEIWNAVAGTGEHFWDILKRYLEIHKPKP